MTNKKNFPKQSKQKIKRDVLAGVGGRFRIAGTSIGSHGCFRQGTLGRLRLLGIGPRSVASIRRSRALTTGTTNVIIGMLLLLLLLPRQVHGRIRCRDHRGTVGRRHHHHRGWAWPRLRQVITVNRNHLARCQVDRWAVLRMLLPPWTLLHHTRLVPTVRFRRIHQSLLQLRRVPRFVRGLQK